MGEEITDWKCPEFLGKINLEGGITRTERVESLVLAEEGANKQEQIYSSEPWKRQEWTILDTAEAGSELWGKNREFVESLIRVSYSSPCPLPLYEQTTDY